MTFDRRNVLRLGALGLATLGGIPALAADAPVVPVTIDPGKVLGPLPHIWSECAGSDRAAVTLREEWRKDLGRWVSETGLKRVRFHGIFNDELGVFAPSILNRGKATAPNFQGVDEVYDGLLARGVDPFIELSFMPSHLASGKTTFGFYNGNITPPKTMESWSDFIRQFTLHLIDRYGIEKVRRWPMEVWNEPNLPFFWTSDQATYFDMYKATVTAIKAIDPAIKVGGPSTAQGAWISDFASYCAANNLPVDFFSTHCYAGDNQEKLFGTNLALPQSQVIPEVVKRCRQQIEASAYAGTPLWLGEWSADSPALIAHIVAGCLPYCQAMSQWTMSSTYEELGVADYVLKEGDMGYGTMVHQIPKMPFNTYKLMHQLGDVRLAAEGPALASRRANGKLSTLVWNLAEVQQPSGIPGMSSNRTVKGEDRTLQVTIAGAARRNVSVQFVDPQRGSPLPAWRAMGSPQYPRQDQLAILRQAAEIAAPVSMKLDAHGSLNLPLPAEGLALITLA